MKNDHEYLFEFIQLEELKKPVLIYFHLIFHYFFLYFFHKSGRRRRVISSDCPKRQSLIFL